ncbi:MAG: PAS domain S-box protein [Candidatus Atribacteria bacterium]|nr:PAS domain S-box protein [Candidatus Atribacteria bacterium]
MKDTDKTKDQLIQEIARMQKKIADLEEIKVEGKRAKEELKESEKKYRDLVEETPIGIANISITGKIIYINKRLEKISGYSREEVLGKNVFKLGIFPDEMLNFLKERLKVRLRGGSTQQRREIRFKYKNGKWIWIEITAKLIKKWGIPTSFRITVQDITERKKAEEELKNSEERLKILFDYAPDAYYINDLKGKFIDGNIAAERMIGYKKEELIGSSFLKLKLLSLANIPKAAKVLAKNIIGQPTGPDEFVLNRKDNSKVTVEISTYPVKIMGRTLVLGIARDITERKKAEQQIKQGYKKLQRTMEATINTISKIIEARDPYTAGHQLKVSKLANSIAQEMKLPEDKIEGMRIAALVHDIGKINIPAEILSKPSKLNEMEFSLIKNHPKTGYDILKTIDFPWPVARIVLQHHEKIDGSGYPQGQKSNKILLEAKIIGVADVVEAMSSHRPYRPALGIDKALEEISQNRGILYDPEVTDACLKLFKEKGFKFEL